MAIYEATLFSTYYGQNCLNRWNYVSGGIPSAVAGSFALASAMGLAPVGGPTTLYGRLKTLLNAAVTFVGYKVVNLYDDEDFYAAGFGSVQAGLKSGEGLSPSAAFGFRSNQVRLDVDRGYKRFVGVTEDTSNPGGGIAPAFLSGDLTPFANLMGTILEYVDEGTPISFSPAILGRESYTTPSGRTAYRKYATETAMLEHTAIGITWEPYANSRTQVSRQYGRGF